MHDLLLSAVLAGLWFYCGVEELESSLCMRVSNVPHKTNLIFSNIHPIGERKVSLECWQPRLSNHVKIFANSYARFLFNPIALASARFRALLSHSEISSTSSA